MKVGIDTFGLDHGRSGLGSYLLSLLPVLPKDDDIEYRLFGSEMDRYTFTGERGIPFESVSVPDSLNAERLWHTFNANTFARRHKYDVVFFASGSRMLPVRNKVPSVAVVNDILSTVLSSYDYLSASMLKKALNRASYIICASNYIKKDLIRSGIRSNNIEVIHNGINHSMFFPVQHDSTSDGIVDIKPFAIKRPYFIYASRMTGPEKKHVELIKAFTAFKEKTKLPYRLVIAGSESKYGEEVHKAVFNSSAASDIFLTGFFPHESFPELYRNAEACIFPSVNEGVGLPVLEAMACGIPVLCSSSGALGEMAGNNAIFFDSDNIDEMESCMERIVEDKDLKEKLIAGAVEWVSRYTWEKTASKTMEIIRKVSR